MTVVEVVVVVVEGAVVVVIEIAVTVVVVVVVVVEDAVAMVGSAGGSGSGIEVVLVVPSGSCCRWKRGGRQVGTSASQCLLRQETDLFCMEGPSLSPSIYYFWQTRYPFGILLLKTDVPCIYLLIVDHLFMNKLNWYVRLLLLFISEAWKRHTFWVELPHIGSTSPWKLSLTMLLFAQVL